MIKLTPEDLVAWNEGKVSFKALRNLYKVESQELCEALGIPNPSSVIAIKHVDDTDWPAEYVLAIRHARYCYDSGTHNIAQGRTKFYFFLYSFKRKVCLNKDELPNYFKLSE